MAAALARHNELFAQRSKRTADTSSKPSAMRFAPLLPAHPKRSQQRCTRSARWHAEDFSAVDGIRVRMALHAGYAQERDGDYFGPALNRVARLVAIGHGGQIADLGYRRQSCCETRCLRQRELRDLGSHRLKDLTRPERVYQVLRAGSARRRFRRCARSSIFPIICRSSSPRSWGVPGSLKRSRRCCTSIGLRRWSERAAPARRAAQFKPGAEVLDRYADGVWMVELAPISDPALVTTTIAQVLGVREVRNEDLLDDAARRSRAAPATASFSTTASISSTKQAASPRRDPGRLRRRCDSGNEPRAAGHRGRTSLSHAVAGSEAEAVELFVDRARASDDRFALTDENAPFVAEICRRLDGIPLAVELAAARVKLLSPKQLTEKLNERFRVLTGGDKSALPRHQTLRATIDWSFDLLDETSRALFRKLSIFVGGWTLDGRDGDLRGCTRDEWEVLDALSSLVDKSLVSVEAKRRAALRHAGLDPRVCERAPRRSQRSAKRPPRNTRTFTPHSCIDLATARARTRGRAMAAQACRTSSTTCAPP